MEELFQWDAETLQYLNQLGSPYLDSFWIAVTHGATWIPLYLLIIGSFLLKETRKEALLKILTTVLALLLILVITHWVKEYVGRLRPNNDSQIKNVINVLKNAGGFSFFSGHAASSAVVASVAFLFLKKHSRWALLLFIWPVLFSYSRIAIGVHYPIDIIAGSVVGVVFGILVYRLYYRLRPPDLG